MEIYKKYFKLIFIPSFSILLFLIVSIISAYSFYLNDSKNYTVEIILFLTSSFIAYFTINNSIINKNDNKYFKNITTYIFIIFIIISISFFNISKSFKPVNFNSSKLFNLKVESIIDKRYYKRIIVSSVIKKNNLKGIFFIYGATSLKNNDILSVAKKKIIKIKDQPGDSIYSSNLRREGISFTGNLSPGDYKIISSSERSIKNKIKDKIIFLIDTNFSDETSPLLKGLYFGNKNYISKKTIINFKKAGLMHLLAASGLHVGIIASIPLLLLGFIRINKNITLIITFLILLFYLYITDMPVSLIRAAVMFGIYTVQSLFRFDKNIFNTLFLSAILILIFLPHEIFNLGFQLSFGATFGILLFYNAYKKFFKFLPSYIASSISVTFAAQLIAIPIILYQLKELNITGFISNIFAVPLMGLLLIGSILINFLSMIYIDIGIYFGKIIDMIYTLMVKSISLISNLNGNYIIDDFNIILIVIIILLLGPLIPIEKKKKLVSYLLILFITTISIFISNGRASNLNHITLFTHSEGKTAIIEINNKNFIIGNLPDKKELKKITLYLKENNIKNYNIYITNPNYYNISSYTSLIKIGVVEKCYLSANFNLKKNMKIFFKLLATDKVKLLIKDLKPANKNTHSLISELNNISNKSNYFNIILAIYNILLNDEHNLIIKYFSIDEVSIVINFND